VSLKVVDIWDGIHVAHQALSDAGYTDWDWQTMLAIAGAESSWRHNAISGTNDYGTWQINNHYWPQLFSQYQWNDPYDNVKMAHAVWKVQGYRAWSTYKNGAYQRYVPAAAAELGNPVDPNGPVYSPPVGIGSSPTMNGSPSHSATVQALGNNHKQHATNLASFSKAIRALIK
jgi:hypothetical protein